MSFKSSFLTSKFPFYSSSLFQFCLNSGHFELKLFNQLKNQDRLTKTSAEWLVHLFLIQKFDI